MNFVNESPRREVILDIPEKLKQLLRELQRSKSLFDLCALLNAVNESLDEWNANNAMYIVHLGDIVRLNRLPHFCEYEGNVQVLPKGFLSQDDSRWLVFASEIYIPTTKGEPLLKKTLSAVIPKGIG